MKSKYIDINIVANRNHDTKKQAYSRGHMMFDKCVHSCDFIDARQKYQHRSLAHGFLSHSIVVEICHGCDQIQRHVVELIGNVRLEYVKAARGLSIGRSSNN